MRLREVMCRQSVHSQNALSGRNVSSGQVSSKCSVMEQGVARREYVVRDCVARGNASSGGCVVRLVRISEWVVRGQMTNDNVSSTTRLQRTEIDTRIFNIHIYIYIHIFYVCVILIIMIIISMIIISIIVIIFSSWYS